MSYPAFVYYNLHKLVFSVKNRTTGRVVAHFPTVLMSGVEFRVQPGGRARVLRERRKNVHAGLCGTVTGLSDVVSVVDEVDAVEITYNPYEYATFVVVGSGAPVRTATRVFASGKRVWAWDINRV